MLYHIFASPVLIPFAMTFSRHAVAKASGLARGPAGALLPSDIGTAQLHFRPVLRIEKGPFTRTAQRRHSVRTHPGRASLQTASTLRSTYESKGFGSCSSSSWLTHAAMNGAQTALLFPTSRAKVRPSASTKNT